MRAAHRTDLIACLLRQFGDRDIGKPAPLRRRKQLRSERSRSKLILHIRNMFELMDEPLVHLCNIRNRINRKFSASQCFGNDKNALIVDENKLLLHTRIIPSGKAVKIEAIHTDLKGTYGLEDCSLKAAINGHHLACCLHLCAECMISVDKLIKRPTRELHHAVVDRRLKACLRLLCDGVYNLIECVANCNLRGHLCDRVSCRLGRECRGTTDARIDLDDIVLIALRIERILGVAAPLNAEFANDAKARTAQHLILIIRQCLCRSNNDTISCMNTNRVKILHTANGDAVVIAVTDDFKLDFLPSGNAALDEHLPDHRVVEPLDNGRNELFFVLGNTAARAAHCIRRTYNDRISN